MAWRRGSGHWRSRSLEKAVIIENDPDEVSLSSRPTIIFTSVENPVLSTSPHPPYSPGFSSRGFEQHSRGRGQFSPSQYQGQPISRGNIIQQPFIVRSPSSENRGRLSLSKGRSYTADDLSYGNRPEDQDDREENFREAYGQESFESTNVLNGHPLSGADYVGVSSPSQRGTSQRPSYGRIGRQMSRGYDEIDGGGRMGDNGEDDMNGYGGNDYYVHQEYYGDGSGSERTYSPRTDPRVQPRGQARPQNWDDPSSPIQNPGVSRLETSWSGSKSNSGQYYSPNQHAQAAYAQGSPVHQQQAYGYSSPRTYGYSQQQPMYDRNIEPEYSQMVEIAHDKIGLVIGKQGKTIQRIEQFSGVLVTKPKRDQPPIFTIMGSEENVMKARMMILATAYPLSEGNTIKSSIPHVVCPDGQISFSKLSPEDASCFDFNYRDVYVIGLPPSIPDEPLNLALDTSNAAAHLGQFRHDIEESLSREAPEGSFHLKAYARLTKLSLQHHLRSSYLLEYSRLINIQSCWKGRGFDLVFKPILPLLKWP